MKSVFRLSAWLPAILALGAHAQTQPDPADPSLSAPLPPYRSAFDGYRSAPEPAPPSLQRWRAVNNAVGNLNAHAGHAGMQHESVEQKHEHHAEYAEHAGHSMHHHMEGMSE